MEENNRIFKKIYQKGKIKRYLELIVGSLLVATAFNLFCSPNNLVAGGISGLSIIVHHIFKIDSSLFILIVDLFLLVISYFTLGKEKTMHSVLGSLLFPIFVKLTQNINSILELDTSVLLLAVIFAGIIQGSGSGLIFKAGFSLGGTDIINQIISKYCKISIGNAMYFSDGAIVLLSGLAFGINKIMYALLLLYIISYITDRVILGISDSKAFYIITKEDEKIKEYIIKSLKHSVTELSAKGGFAKKKETVLMCVLPTKEYYRFKEGINEIDPKAFFVVTDAYEVAGGA